MTRESFILDLHDEEYRRLLKLSEDTTMEAPMAGHKVEWQECLERLQLIEQLIDEIPMDYIVDDKVTGSIKQVFIGRVEGQPLKYINCRDFTDKYYLMELIIKDCGDEETYKNKRLLRLSSRVWCDWFLNSKYEGEKEQRIADNLSTYVKVTVVDDKVWEMEWYE